MNFDFFNDSVPPELTHYNCFHNINTMPLNPFKFQQYMCLQKQYATHLQNNAIIKNI